MFAFLMIYSDVRNGRVKILNFTNMCFKVYNSNIPYLEKLNNMRNNLRISDQLVQLLDAIYFHKHLGYVSL